jgi:seryl-tRNA synthetase
MLDINRIEKQPREIEALLKRKGWEVDLTPIIEEVAQKRALLFKIEQVKAEVNRLSASVPQLKKAGQDVKPLFERVKQLNASIASDEKTLKELEAALNDKLSVLPNTPDPDLKAGGKEHNEVIDTFGDMPAFDFPIKDHVELATSLHLVDYARAAKISGAGTWMYTGSAPNSNGPC